MSKNEAKKAALDKALMKYAENKDVLKDNENLKGFVAELKEIKKVVAKKDPLVREFINLHREAETKKYTIVGRLVTEMKQIAAKQEILRMAAELCEKEEEKQSLIKQSESLNNHPAMVGYGKYIKGLKYLAGMDKELDPDVKAFFRNELREDLPGKDTDYERYRIGEQEFVRQRKIDLANLLKDIEPEKEAYKKRVEEAAGKQLSKEEREDLQKAKVKIDNMESLISRYRSETSEEMEEYKDMQQAYRNVCAPAKAMDIYAKTRVSANVLIEQFLGDYENTTPNLNKDAPFSGRMTPGAFLLGRMLNDGYSLEDIMNPKAFLAEKKKYGAEYMEHRQKDDKGWYAEEMYKSAEGIMKGIEEYCIKHKDTLKTGKDLTLHGDNLALAGLMAWDMFQELPKCKDYGVTTSAQKFTEQSEKAFGYSFVLGYGGRLSVEYNLVQKANMDIENTTEEVARQLLINKLLDEIKKDKPDFESTLLSVEQHRNIIHQAEVIPELKSLFDESEQIDIDSLTVEDMKTLATMRTTEFLEKNNIVYVPLKKPVKVVNPPEDSMFREGQDINVMILSHDKQVITTDIPAKMDSFLKSVEPKGIRGKAKDNSDQFNQLLTTYDDTINKFKDKAIDEKSIQEMRDLKAAAEAYVAAKRAQKGYEAKGTLDEEIDDKMLGKESGASIFTTRGKDRYEFALNILEKVQELEDKFGSVEKQNGSMEKEEDELDSLMM